MPITTRVSAAGDYVEIDAGDGVIARIPTVALLDPATGLPYGAGQAPGGAAAVVPGTFWQKSIAAAYVSLDAANVKTVEIKNTRPGAVDVAVRRGAGGAVVCVPAGGADRFAVTNASDLQLARFDGATASVIVSGEAWA